MRFIKLILQLFQTSNDKAYRQRKGGKWFKICLPDYGGWSSGSFFWTDKIHEEAEVIDVEDYSHIK